MFQIEYKIMREQFKEIERISEEEIHYNFLLGNLTLFSSDTKIEMEWEWIPLLDFAYCLNAIGSNLKTKDNKDCFEFTENAETLEFLKEREQLKITASFSSAIITTTFTEFEKAVSHFHYTISEYIRGKIPSEPPKTLQKYLFVEAS